jgi:hypothetical protein
MTSHSAGGAIGDSVGLHADYTEAQATTEAVHDTDSPSLKSVEIPLDSPPRSPPKSSAHARILSSGDPIPSPAHTEASFSAIQDHPVLAKGFDAATKPPRSEVPPTTSTEDAHATTAEAPSTSSTRTSMAPSLASTIASEAESITSITSSVSVAKKVRPESVVINPGPTRLILGLAVVDFNHLVSPIINVCHHNDA